MTLSRVRLPLPSLPACEPTIEPPSVEGLSAQDAADIAADLACNYVDRCGIISVSCADCDDALDCGGCLVEEISVTEDQCRDELTPELEQGIGCRPLTADEEARVDECLAALPPAECPSVEAVEAWANGGGGEDPRDPGPCDVIEALRSRCGDTTAPGGRMPDSVTPE